MCVVFKTVQPPSRFRAAIGLFAYFCNLSHRSTPSNSYSHFLFTPLPTPYPIKLLLSRTLQPAHPGEPPTPAPFSAPCLHPTPSNSYSYRQYSPRTLYTTYSYNLLHCRLTLTQFSALSYLVTLTPAYV